MAAVRKRHASNEADAALEHSKALGRQAPIRVAPDREDAALDLREDLKRTMVRWADVLARGGLRSYCTFVSPSMLRIWSISFMRVSQMS